MTRAELDAIRAEYEELYTGPNGRDPNYVWTKPEGQILNCADNVPDLLAHIAEQGVAIDVAHKHLIDSEFYAAVLENILRGILVRLRCECEVRKFINFEGPCLKCELQAALDAAGRKPNA